MAEALWADVAQAYDRSFSLLCAGAVPAILERLPEGSRVLDVGCGSGRLTRALVDAGHQVDAVDPDPEMVAITRVRSGVDASVGGLPLLPRADPYDAVTAAFVVNHVDDPAACASALVAALRPGGLCVASIWSSTPPPQALLFGDVCDAVGAVRPALPRLAPDLDFERSAQGLAGLFSAAGAEVVEACDITWTWRVSPDDLWAGLAAVGNFGVVTRAQSPEVAARMRAEFEARTAGVTELEFDVSAPLVVARASG